MSAELTAVDRVLKALADPTRLRIVGLLRGGEVCVCHLHDTLHISQPKASRHLAYLRRAGVVRGSKRGLWVYYSLAPQPQPLAQRVLDHLAATTADARDIAADRQRLDKQRACCVPAPTTVTGRAARPRPPYTR